MPPFLHDMIIGPASNLLRTAVLGVLAYGTLVLVLRTSGKRTLSKLNAFDLVVTVALGSSLATILLSKDTSLLQGLTGFAVLAGMQFLVAWVSVRSERVNQLVKASPALVFYRGRAMPQALRRERLTMDEILAAVRNHGIARLEDVDAVVLESDGSLSVLRCNASEMSALGNVATPDAA